MATIVYPNGNSGDITIPVNEKIAVFSWSPVQVFQKVGYPNFPTTLDLIYTTAAGETYTSSAFAAGATLVLEPSAAQAFYEVGAAPVIAEPSADLSAAATPWVLAGLAAAQGGSAQLKGGTSSTSGNAGGAALLTGGQPGATGVGGAATIAAGAGGATSGNGGVASLTGGAGTNGNGVGGVSKVVGGAGQGTGAGGQAQVTGGASGAGATGDGGDAAVTGGAALSTNGNGGSVILVGGVKAGSGIDGGVFNRGTNQFRKQAAAVAEADADGSITAAEMINGIVVHTVTTGRTMTTPTGAQLSAAIPDLAVGDSFDFTLITLGTGADDISTLTAGDGNVTFVGKVTVGPETAAIANYGTWRFRNTGANTWVGYRVG